MAGLQLDSEGGSGSILTLWVENKVLMLLALEGRFSVTISIFISQLNTVVITNVYGSNDYRERKLLWTELRFQGSVIIFGALEVILISQDGFRIDLMRKSYKRYEEIQ